MNTVLLKGTIRDIKESHNINGIQYDQANIIVKRGTDKEDIISLKFKKFCNKYREGDFVELTGNLRSYSQKIDDNHNRVSLYVFTYFDQIPYEYIMNNETNSVELSGRICKVEKLRDTSSGKCNLHFILANNIISEDKNQKLNNYIPSCAWGKLAIDLSKKLQISDKVIVRGQLHSRTYKKQLENGETEYRTAHELLVTELEWDNSNE